MNKRLMLTILFLSFSVSLFSQVNPDTLPEKYVKKVIIEAKWGKGPGEFGRTWNSDMQIWATPSNFAVDKKGRVYIEDLANYRLQIFDNNGHYLSEVLFNKSTSFYGPLQIAVDKKGCIYFLTQKPNEIPIGNKKVVLNVYVIYKYDQQGNLLNTYDMNLRNYFTEKLKEADISSYLSGLPPHYKLEIRDGKIMVGDMIVGTTSKSFQNVKKESNVFNFEFNLKERKEVRVTIGGKSITVRVLKGVYTADYCGTDSEKNIYISEEKESENGKDTLLILKYDLIGRLRSCIKYSENGHIENVVDRKVDNNGNIYLLVCSDEGLKILKYEKE